MTKQRAIQLLKKSRHRHKNTGALFTLFAYCAHAGRGWTEEFGDSRVRALGTTAIKNIFLDQHQWPSRSNHLRLSVSM